jgi:hypothetical protein
MTLSGSELVTFRLAAWSQPSTLPHAIEYTLAENKRSSNHVACASDLQCRLTSAVKRKTCKKYVAEQSKTLLSASTSKWVFTLVRFVYTLHRVVG